MMRHSFWSQNFEHISYEVATRYDEDTQEAEDHSFNFTDELNRLSDYCNTATDYVELSPVDAKLSDRQKKSCLALKK